MILTPLHVRKEERENVKLDSIQNNASADGFAKQLLEMGNGKLAIDESTTTHRIANKFL